MLKYRIDSLFSGTPYGQTAFGSEPLYNNGDEAVFHKWCGIKGKEQQLYVVNNGTYGGSFSNNSMKLSLLRTPVYSAHPIRKRQLVPHDRFLNHIDMGERKFSFRITNETNIDKTAQIFNEKPPVMSFFPSGDGVKKESFVTIDNDEVIVSSIRNNGTGYEITVFNTTNKSIKATLTFKPIDKNCTVELGGNEFKIIQI